MGVGLRRAWWMALEVEDVGEALAMLRACVGVCCVVRGYDEDGLALGVLLLG